MAIGRIDSDEVKGVRDRHKYLLDQWKPIREQGAIDMRYLSGQPWTEDDVRERKGAGRFTLSFDEITQYCNQLINDIRQNKRAVKAEPKGYGASEMTSRERGGLMRQIEYKSDAQAAYRTAFENAVQRSYGGWKYVTAYVSDSAFEQEIRIKRIPNPDVLLMDWDAREADFSDGEDAFELETISVKEFRKKWPDATKQSFNGEDIRHYDQWIKAEDRLQIASYWKVHKTRDKLFLLENGRTVGKNELVDQFGKGIEWGGNYIKTPDGVTHNFVTWRKTEAKQVIQQITNGVEILEENEWAGIYIPIVFITGKEIYVDEGRGPERKLMSLIRLARDAYQSYCYLWCSQIEMAQMMPKAPLAGYEGQFATKTKWQELHKTLNAYIEFKAATEETKALGFQGILPPPQRPAYTADVQALEIMKESALRAIQSAMGVPQGLLNGQRGQDAEARSGIALKTLDQQESQANFHFIDNLDLGLEYGGRIMDDLINPIYYEKDRELGFRKASGDHYTMKVNQLDAEGRRVGFHTDQGDHDIMITTGPSFDSERQEGQEFIENTVQTVAQINPMAGLITLISAIKLKNLGPIGDDLVQKLEAIAGQNQQGGPAAMQAMQANMQKMAQKLQELLLEKKAKILEIQGKMQLEQTKLAGKQWEVTQDQAVQLENTRMNNEAMLLQAMVKAGLEQQAAAYEQINSHFIQIFEAMHEGMQAAFDRQHDLNLASHQAALTPAPQPGQPGQPQQ